MNQNIRTSDPVIFSTTTINGSISLSPDNDGIINIGRENSSSNKAVIKYSGTSTTSLVFKNNAGSEVLQLNNSGQIGIGMSPSQTLDISSGFIRFPYGKMTSQANVTTSNTASSDGGFYFKDGYFVLYYNNGGTMKYIKIDVNAQASTFSSGAP
ncbi:MAG TPA: hypothetical protein PK876_10105 [Elusimicrobiota bacterium]|nr:hypothetical protein [Elusimicrobiota bacterium]